MGRDSLFRSSLTLCRSEVKRSRREFHVILIHLLVHYLLCQDLLNHAHDLRVVHILSLDSSGREQFVKLSLVIFASCAPQQHAHVNGLDEVVLGDLDLVFALSGDRLQALHFQLIGCQLLMQLSEVHVEDGAVGDAFVEVEADKFLFIEALNGRKVT